MFYSQFILAKKGPLGTIWIAAHLERKLRKNQVADTDIGVSVDSILFPEVPIALRLSSHLLLGVVRIYSRKVNYLFDDCSEALLKVKQAFRSAAVDLPPEESTAPYHSITLPETFDLDDFELPENEIFQGNYVDHHVSAREQITLQDTMDGVVYSTSQFGLDERFGDGDTSQVVLDLDEEVFQDKDDAVEGDGGISGADRHDACLDAATFEMKESEAGAPEAMPVYCSEAQDGGLGASSGLNEYAQAPQTPGLVEVPNLSSVREACDDHVEVEGQSALLVSEEVRTVSSELNNRQMEKSVKDPSFESNDGQNSNLNMTPDDTSDPDKQIKCGGESTTTDLAGDGKTDGQNKPEKEGMEHVHVESPCCSHVTTEMEDPGQVMTVPGAPIPDVMTTKSEADVLDSVPPLESPERPTVVDAEHPICQEPKDPGTETQGDNGNATEANQESNSSLRGNVQADSRRSDEQLDNVHATDNQLENLTGTADSDLPAPERLLSVPEGLAEKENDLMIESTPDKDDVGMAKGDAATKNISGKKRTFTESTLTAESMNSVESVGLIRSRRTADLVPDDDDLLSSILVGRSSFLKMKPTPVLEVASNKRMRSAARSTVSKRKVLMDDPMVLHGDIIRQQLTDTEDIRRVRKKAPCTPPEILMLHRQFLEDELFKEPIFTGMSVELVSLHSEPYDLKGIRIMESDDHHVSAEVVKDNECSVRPDVVEEDRIEGSSAPTVSGNDAEEQAAEAHNPPQDQQNKDHDANEVNHSVTDEICGVPTGDKNDVVDLQVNGSCENLDGKMDGDVADDVPAVDISNKSSTDSIEVADGDVEHMVLEMDLKAEDKLLEDEMKADASAEGSEIEKDCHAPHDNAIDSLATGSVGAGSASDPALVNSEPIGEENNIGQQIAEIESDDKDKACNGLSNEEEMKASSECPPEPDFDNRSSIPYDKDNPNFDEVDMLSAADVGTTSQDFPVGDHAEMENTAVEHDTEFLNVDDDEVGEDDDDDGDGDETRLLENSGWSARTRAVAKYLQTLFDKEAESGKSVLAVDNLLTGKTRKEASRMFFETLVLKTRDYVQVEQPKPFDNICIKPRAKLMKSVF